MGNIEFSKSGAAILRNKALTDYIVERLSNITPEEEKRGEVEIKYLLGDEEKSMILKVGPQKKHRKLAAA
jgi:hypothetical protein